MLTRSTAVRLSIEITPEQHQYLKVSAALEGKTIKAYVLERALADASESAAGQLEALLRRRLEQAEKGSRSAKTVDQLVDEVLQEGADR